jgi:hypothetical protein
MPGLVGNSATQPLIENLDKVAPGPAKSIFTPKAGQAGATRA